MWTKERLLSLLENGERIKYLFFWSHNPRRPGIIDHSCFSQWYPAQFEVDGVLYPTAEHYMMAEKARLFDDHATEKEILASSHPGEAKQLGRKVSDFDQAQWDSQRTEIVIRGNIAKFQQDDDLKTYLLNTAQRILVEASPRDQVWGIGLSADDPAAEQPGLWQGLNLLGFALMKVRDQLREEQG